MRDNQHACFCLASTPQGKSIVDRQLPHRFQLGAASHHAPNYRIVFVCWCFLFYFRTFMFLHVGFLLRFVCVRKTTNSHARRLFFTGEEEFVKDHQSIRGKLNSITWQKVLNKYNYLNHHLCCSTVCTVRNGRGVFDFTGRLDLTSLHGHVAPASLFLK